MKKNFYNKKQLLIQIKKYKSENKIIVFTNGVFDIIHSGHIDLLCKAKKEGDILIVGINSDISVKKIKGPKRPINNEYSRAFVLSNIKPVDHVIIFKETTPEKIISIIKPNIHVKGGDYNPRNMPETKIVEKYGGKVKILPLNKNYSVSNLITKIIKENPVKIKTKKSFSA